MFNKKIFADIIRNIKDKYESQEEFSKVSRISRTYLSLYMNMKIDEVPSRKMLKKLADASLGEITYERLLILCDYVDEHFELLFYSDIYVHNPYVKNDYILEDVVMDIAYMYENIKNIAYNDADKKLIIDAYNYAINNKTYSYYVRLYKDLLNNLKTEKFYIQSHKEQKNNFKNVPNTKSSNIFPSPNNQLYMCPVYGHIAAGVPNWAEQCIEGRLPLDPGMMNIHNPEECFFLRVSGESMNKVVKNGGYALIRKQEDVENGEIAVVLVNGYDATLKKFTRKNDMVILEPMSNDSSYEIQIYDHNTQIKILGKYIGKFEMN